MPTRKALPARVSVTDKLDILTDAFTEFTRGDGNGTPGAYERFRNIDVQFQSVQNEIAKTNLLIKEHAISTMHSPETAAIVAAAAEHLREKLAEQEAEKAKKDARETFLKRAAASAIGGVFGIIGGIISMLNGTPK